MITQTSNTYYQIDLNNKNKSKPEALQRPIGSDKMRYIFFEKKNYNFQHWENAQKPGYTKVKGGS